MKTAIKNDKVYVELSMSEAKHLEEIVPELSNKLRELLYKGRPAPDWRRPWVYRES